MTQDADHPEGVTRDADDARQLRAIARGGPCGACLHARLVRTPRGSSFLRCVHPEMPKYPPQPLAHCDYQEPVATA